MKTWIFVFFGILLVGFVLYYRTHPLVSKVVIGDHQIRVEVAVTEEQKQKGLGGRPTLPQESGMLFPYDHKEDYNFWMRDMQFPLDFIWIDGRTIVDITENVPPPKPGENPVVVKPKVLVDTILELNAGTVKRLDIKIGDTVTFLDR